jgi:hypothetical protein
MFRVTERMDTDSSPPVYLQTTSLSSTFLPLSSQHATYFWAFVSSTDSFVRFPDFIEADGDDV